MGLGFEAKSIGAPESIVFYSLILHAFVGSNRPGYPRRYTAVFAFPMLVWTQGVCFRPGKAEGPPTQTQTHRYSAYPSGCQGSLTQEETGRKTKRGHAGGTGWVPAWPLAEGMPVPPPMPGCLGTGMDL